MEKRELLQHLRNLGKIPVPNSLATKLATRLEMVKGRNASHSIATTAGRQEDMSLLFSSTNGRAGNVPTQMIGGQLKGQSVGLTTPNTMTLDELSISCVQELSNFRHKEPSDDSYCLEIFRRALKTHNEEAWAVLYNNFSQSVRLWLRRHQYREAALRYESEQGYVDDTFKRFWQWTCNQHLEFANLAGALSALHLCLNSSVMDTLRAYSRPKEEPIPEMSLFSEDKSLVTEDSYNTDEFWLVITTILTNQRELRVIYLIFHCGLKPKEITLRCPGEFTDEHEIYRLTRNALDRLRRNGGNLRWKLGNEEENC